MDGPDTATNGQRSRELKRKQQLREAQRRLRQRKVEALQDATSEVEALRKQLAEATETIARLSAQSSTPTINEIATLNTIRSHQPGRGHRGGIENGHSMNSQADFEEPTIAQNVLGESWSPVSPSTLESFFPGSSNDLLALDIPDVFHFPQSSSTSERSPPLNLTHKSSGHDSRPIWPLGYTAVLDDYVPYMPLAAHSDSPSSPSVQTVGQSSPPPYSPFRESTFAKRLWRRCAEMALRMLTDTRKNQPSIERAFGAYFDRFSPEVVRRSLSTALGRDDFGELEYHAYPDFQFSSHNRVIQNASTDKLMGPEHIDLAEDPYMTPRDIEKYFVWNGQLRQSLDPKGNIVTSPCHFDFQGKRWILEENRLIHTLMHFSVCLGQGPALLASHVIAATFQSMQRVTI
ncbi:unnamed protein product [Aureobasidium uvarum]|uniref:BZIP domain-containing protein n=1 Tax=Aureobasidium uvarum TaxID=2773716 RepID=A0A9N8PW88_9PEZI|nr:unnamed protein product [Aureobasidium uvarum]